MSRTYRRTLGVWIKENNIKHPLFKYAKPYYYYSYKDGIVLSDERYLYCDYSSKLRVTENDMISYNYDYSGGDGPGKVAGLSYCFREIHKPSNRSPKVGRRPYHRRIRLYQNKILKEHIEDCEELTETSTLIT